MPLKGSTRLRLGSTLPHRLVPLSGPLPAPISQLLHEHPSAHKSGGWATEGPVMRETTGPRPLRLAAAPACCMLLAAHSCHAVPSGRLRSQHPYTWKLLPACLPAGAAGEGYLRRELGLREVGVERCCAWPKSGVPKAPPGEGGAVPNRPPGLATGTCPSDMPNAVVVWPANRVEGGEAWLRQP